MVYKCEGVHVSTNSRAPLDVIRVILAATGRLPIFRGKRICQAPAIRRKSASREVASGGQRKRRAMSGLSQIAEFERRPARGRNQKSNFARATDPPGDLRCPIYNCVYKGLSLTDRI